MSTVRPLAAPPDRGTPVTDPRWMDWFQGVWSTIGEGLDNSGPQGTFPKLRVSDATFDDANMFQLLLRVDKGIYVTYSSAINNITYGFAANVYRSGGNEISVGCQCSALAGKGVATQMFGSNFNAIQYAGADCSLIGQELGIANYDDSSVKAKIAQDVTFGDGGAVNGMGNNHYNTFSIGTRYSGSGRSANGEFCGWNVGISFTNNSLDQDNPPAWSAATTYGIGQCVTNGGLVWIAILANVGSAPPSAPWVQRTVTGTANLAVGIDFTPMSATTMGRMFNAIRLKESMTMGWNESGQINTFYDGSGGRTRFVFSNWSGAVHNRKFQVDMTNGELWVSNGIVALGGGAAATLGTIGGAGPTAAAQAGWYRIIDSTGGTPFWVPMWR